MVTSGTYQKFLFFGGDDRLTRLTKLLLALADRYEWKLQAWAVFPNHYHFIGISDGPKSLRQFVAHLHSASAKGVNQLDGKPGRKVWYQYWDSQITYSNSYFSRLNYVHQNAVHHGLVRTATEYPWCSAAWFEHKATPSFLKTVQKFKFDKLKLPDEFEVTDASRIPGKLPPSS